jgi:protease-4
MNRMRIYLSFVLVALAWSAVGCAPMTITLNTDGPSGLESKLVVSDEERTRNKIAIIDIAGTLVNGHQTQLLGRGIHPVSLLHEKLEEAHEDSNVKAIILRLNTPGGTVTASDIMYREVLRFKKRSGKPVIVLMMDVAASGGYYISCAADHIVAYPSTVTGSIGVILQTVNFKPLMDKIGVNAEALTSGKNKAAGSPFEALEDEHRQILQSLVDDFYKRFVEVVRKGRPNIPADQFDMVVDGRVFSAGKAKELGLVDQLGDIYDAWDVAKEKAGIEHANLIIYHRPLASPASPYASSPVGGAGATSGAQVPPGGTQVNFAQINVSDLFTQRPSGFYYIWSPQP